MTRPARLLAALAGLLLMLLPAAAQQAPRLGGTYYGIDAAQGITLSLQPSGSGYSGSLTAGAGGQAGITARGEGLEAVGPLTLRGQPGTVRLSPRPLGLSMIWTPSGGGAPLVYVFRSQAVDLPPVPAGYQPPPPSGGRVDPVAFAYSYEFWPADDVGRTYDAMQDKYRVILRTYPAVHTDVLWKLCQADLAPTSLAAALRGQGVTCASLEAGLKRGQASGGFERFKERVRSEREDAVLAIECARGIHTDQICASAAARTQRAAASLDTAAAFIAGM